MALPAPPGSIEPEGILGFFGGWRRHQYSCAGADVVAKVLCTGFIHDEVGGDHHELVWREVLVSDVDDCSVDVGAEQGFECGLNLLGVWRLEILQRRIGGPVWMGCNGGVKRICD